MDHSSEATALDAGCDPEVTTLRAIANGSGGGESCGDDLENESYGLFNQVSALENLLARKELQVRKLEAEAAIKKADPRMSHLECCVVDERYAPQDQGQ